MKVEEVGETDTHQIQLCQRTLYIPLHVLPNRHVRNFIHQLRDTHQRLFTAHRVLLRSHPVQRIELPICQFIVYAYAFDLLLGMRLDLYRGRESGDSEECEELGFECLEGGCEGLGC